MTSLILTAAAVAAVNVLLLNLVKQRLESGPGASVVGLFSITIWCSLFKLAGLDFVAPLIGSSLSLLGWMLYDGFRSNALRVNKKPKD